MTAVLVTVLIVAATAAGVVGVRRERSVPAAGRAALLRSIAYWLLTVLIAYELAAGALWDLLRIEYVCVVLGHLGYPMYLLLILGVWRIAGALALLAPRFPTLKEWAYAGAFFNYTGAAASHFLAGDRAPLWAGPLVFSVLTLGSWALRPPSRRLQDAPKTQQGYAAWMVPVLTVAAMLVVAFFTLPKGAPQL